LDEARRRAAVDPAVGTFAGTGMTVLQVLLYGLLAAASPGTLVATLAVLGTQRARANGTAFALGFLLGQSAALLIVTAIGSITIGEGSSTASAALELTVGALLLVAAHRARQPARPKPVGGSSRTAKVLERLERVSPRTAFTVGVTLGVGLKRLVITVFAASTIALASVTRSEAIGLGALYVAIATVLVWVPVGLYLVAGKRADEWVETAKNRLAANHREVTFYTSLLFGIVFLLGGLVQLL
jgi:threonine/homoserine/homoserine lactone efflux protein